MILSATIKALTCEAFQKAFPEHAFVVTDIDIAHTKDPQHGDYQCNSAMKFTKMLGRNPRAIAEAIQGFLQQHSLFAEVNIAGPGFINYKIAIPFLAAEVKAMLRDEHLGIARVKPEKVIVEFSSPNVAKELHVGHLRSTIIGDCIARVFEFAGHNVLRLNHIGDWGTAFGMLIAYMEEVAPNVLTGNQQADLTDLMAWYRESKQYFDSDAAFKKKAQLKVVILQQGDPEALKAWQIICQISAKAYQEIYDLLNVKIITRGESFYNPYLAETVEDLTRKGLVVESEGAKCIFMDGFVGKDNTPLPLIVQKSDGGYGYASTDMAAIWHRTQVERADRIIVITDAGQSLHFAMIFAAAKRAGYITDAVRVDHVPFGLVLGADGKKFKTRAGNTEKLIDLLTTGIDKAAAIFKERGMNEQEIPAMAKILGVNALKYADLSVSRVQDYQFSYERMLKFEGNTAAFIMYSLVRVMSIQRKVIARQNISQPSEINPEALQLEHPSEIALALHLVQFPETIDYIMNELYPHRLTDYLFQLANTFNAFFRDCRVEGDALEHSRLVLLELTARVFKTGMDLLGLRVLEKM